MKRKERESGRNYVFEQVKADKLVALEKIQKGSIFTKKPKKWKVNIESRSPEPVLRSPINFGVSDIMSRR